MRHIRRWKIEVAAMAILVALLPVGAGADTSPSYFPPESTLDSTAYTLRLAGSDRYATAATLARVSAVNLGTQGGYPFGEPDGTEPAKAYGFATCPETVGIAAGDTVADALAAAPIKDQTTFQVGDVTLDMTGAVLLVTQSGREGGSDLSPQAVRALEDLSDANCSFDAVVFGGPDAVPPRAFQQLDSFAGTVVRVNGASRFGTAARLATAAGAGGLPKVMLHSGPDSSIEKTGAVIIAEAYTGADALTAGPFAAAHNVPVLLASGEVLPGETQAALEQMQPDTLFVLGGEDVLPQAAMEVAAEASGGAEIIRIGGGDRYETGVMVAEQLMGIYEPPPPGVLGSGDDTHSNLALGFARSEGSGAEHRGFSDALAAAWFLDTFADEALPPLRPAPEIEANADTVADDGTVTHTMIGGAEAPARPPLLLVANDGAPTTEGYVAGLWPDASVIRTAENPDGINDGGFGFLFGGTTAIGEEAGHRLAAALSGATYDPATASDLAPEIDPAMVFYTGADFEDASSDEGGGVDAGGATGPGAKVCTYRGALSGVRSLILYKQSQSATAVFFGSQVVDYQDEVVGEFALQASRFQCIGAEGVAAADLVGLSLSGHATAAVPLSLEEDPSVVHTSTPGEAPEATVEGGDVTAEQSGGATMQTSHTYAGTIVLEVSGAPVTSDFILVLQFTRTDAGQPITGDTADSITFDGTLSLAALGVELPVVGESATTASPLHLAGMYDHGGRRGGLTATLTGGGSDFTLGGLVIDGHF